MVFVACGLNHQTAPVAVRERVALSLSQQAPALASLLSQTPTSEAAILSTCNRTEIYCQTDCPDALIPWLAKNNALAVEELAPYCYLHPAEQGVRHTLRVASGLDSMMLGEPQILGQLKEAFRQAESLGTVHQNLRPIFEYVFQASKRIRSQSGIGNNPISVASAAVQLVQKLFSSLCDKRVFLIGSGDTASLVAKYLSDAGAKQFLVASRTDANAQILASRFQGSIVPIAEIAAHLSAADIVISATACPLPFLTKSIVEYAMQIRSNKAMVILDLAVPRDVEADVGDIPEVSLYNIDSLRDLTTQGLAMRQQAALGAETLVGFEIERYVRWHKAKSANTAIQEYRQKMQALCQDELARALNQLQQHHAPDTVIQELAHRLFQKFVHAPTLGLREAAIADTPEGQEGIDAFFHTLTHHQTTTYEEIA